MKLLKVDVCLLDSPVLSFVLGAEKSCVSSIEWHEQPFDRESRSRFFSARAMQEKTAQQADTKEWS